MLVNRCERRRFSASQIVRATDSRCTRTKKRRQLNLRSLMGLAQEPSVSNEDWPESLNIEGNVQQIWGAVLTRCPCRLIGNANAILATLRHALILAPLDYWLNLL